MQIPILSGIYTDNGPDFRRSYPRNLVPVPVEQGISQGYLRPADGIKTFAAGPGKDRGGINWNGACYRVMGSQLVRIGHDGELRALGDVGAGGQVTFDYSFDVLAIASNGVLHYFDGVLLTRMDAGPVVDFVWVDGYFMITDGQYLMVTELKDRYAANPLKYGSSEADPDPVVALLKLRNEVYALNRHTIEVFDNVGGDNFPFQRIEGAMVPRGCIGTHACAIFSDAIAFIGGGRNEAPAVWLAAAGSAARLSTAEIDRVLGDYTDAQLAEVVMEARVDRGHQHLLIHLPDQTLVYDGAASRVLEQPVWFTLTSSIAGRGQYRARGLVRCYDRWLAGDPTSGAIGELVDTVSTHHGETIGWEFGTQILYNDGRGAIVHELELVGLPGRVPLGAEPVIWTSYSDDGETWSQERAVAAGRQGQRDKRIAWRRQGMLRHWRIQRFRGTSDAQISIARLQANLEALGG